MRTPWSQWTAIAITLAALSLFLAGCGEREKKMGEGTSEAPRQEAPSTALGGPEGPANPCYEKGQAGKEEQKPSERQKQERG